MKKALILLTMLALLAALSTAYACGEHSGSKADATRSFRSLRPRGPVIFRRDRISAARSEWLHV